MLTDEVRELSDGFARVCVARRVDCLVLRDIEAKVKARAAGGSAGGAGVVSRAYVLHIIDEFRSRELWRRRREEETLMHGLRQLETSFGDGGAAGAATTTTTTKTADEAPALASAPPVGAPRTAAEGAALWAALGPFLPVFLETAGAEELGGLSATDLTRSAFACVKGSASLYSGGGAAMRAVREALVAPARGRSRGGDCASAAEEILTSLYPLAGDKGSTAAETSTSGALVLIFEGMRADVRAQLLEGRRLWATLLLLWVCHGIQVYRARQEQQQQRQQLDDSSVDGGGGGGEVSLVGAAREFLESERATLEELLGRLSNAPVTAV